MSSQPACWRLGPLVARTPSRVAPVRRVALHAGRCWRLRAGMCRPPRRRPRGRADSRAGVCWRPRGRVLASAPPSARACADFRAGVAGLARGVHRPSRGHVPSSGRFRADQHHEGPLRRSIHQSRADPFTHPRMTGGRVDGVGHATDVVSFDPLAPGYRAPRPGTRPFGRSQRGGPGRTVPHGVHTVGRGVTDRYRLPGAGGFGRFGAVRGAGCGPVA